MGNRLTKIYTRTGDDGTTRLATGDRVRKECPRVEAYGTVDELNCAIGALLASGALPTAIVGTLGEIQHKLFDLGGELAVPGRAVLTDGDVTELETLLDGFNAGLPPLKDFVLPGGNAPAAACHVARTIARRTERRCWSLAREEAVNAASLRYLNRLSDLLFVLARVLAREGGGSEVIWNPRQPR